MTALLRGAKPRRLDEGDVQPATMGQKCARPAINEMDQEVCQGCRKLRRRAEFLGQEAVPTRTMLQPQAPTRQQSQTRAAGDVARRPEPSGRDGSTDAQRAPRWGSALPPRLSLPGSSVGRADRSSEGTGISNGRAFAVLRPRRDHLG